MESPYYKSKNQEEMQRSILPFETTDQRKRSIWVLSSQSLWGPSVGSTYPFPRLLHLIPSLHTVSTESLLCAKYCNRSWENKVHQSKSLLTKTLYSRKYILFM